MAAEVATRPQPSERRRKPFTQWVRNLANLKNKSNDSQDSKKAGTARNKRNDVYNGNTFKNNPYPESGHLQDQRRSQSSVTNGSGVQTGSYSSLRQSIATNRDASNQNGNRSAAPTVATKPETVHSDSGHSRAITTTTNAGGVSSHDGAAGGDSTFSSPNHSQRSLTTTLTTIQSSGAGQALQTSSGGRSTANHHDLHGSLNNAHAVHFTHQYPVSPSPSPTTTMSALPRHITETIPSTNTYHSTTANGILTDNASILTLASSSKRRRRSMDTDASVRAIAPGSMFGGSRESLPLSVLSGHNADAIPSVGFASQSRPSMGGGLASAERASVYSSQGPGTGVGPGIASERNSYYSYKPSRDKASANADDAKSLRSITNVDTRSLNADARSLGGNEVGSLRGFGNEEGSVRSGVVGHGRGDSASGLVAAGLRPGGAGSLRRRSSEWRAAEDDPEEADGDDGGEHEGANEEIEDRDNSELVVYPSI